MPRKILRITGLVFSIFVAAGPAWAGNKMLNVQGKLTNSSGTALSGTYTVTFRLYVNANDPIAIAVSSETQNVSVSSGSFNATIGSATSLDSIPFNKPYYLGMQVSGDSNELSPRQLLGASAYALGSLGDFNVKGNIISSGSVTVSSITAPSATFTNVNVTGALTSGNTLGKLVQTVTATYTGSVTSTNGSYVPSGLTATITPKSTSDNILILVDGEIGTGTNNERVSATLCRGNCVDLSSGSGGFCEVQAVGGMLYVPCHMHYSDSPSTTSPVTYGAYIKSSNGGTVYWTPAGGLSVITLLEYQP